MNWLLKIAEGPMKGAEIALVGGTRVKIGASDACDIVVADATLGEVAFELDVTESGVTLIRPDGVMREMRPFELLDFGTTAFALGPADGPWEPLTRPPAEDEKPAEEPEPAVEERPVDEEKPVGEAAAEAVPGADPAATDGGQKKGGETRGCAWGCLIVLLLLALLIAAIWWFWPQLKDNEVVAKSRAHAEEIWSRWQGKPIKAVAPVPVAVDVSLRELARQHGLAFVETNGEMRLEGNLKKRTERLAVRALALAADPRAVFNVTDDETLRKSSEELLFACTDGALKAVTATNRVVALTGYAPSPAALERAIRALNADVKGIVGLDTSAVTVGGRPPPVVAKTPFVQEAVRAESALRTAEGKPAMDMPAKSARDYPIAGILTAPYPCVVMRDGLRLVEGAQIGTAVLVKIKADSLTLKDGGQTFEWRP